MAHGSLQPLGREVSAFCWLDVICVPNSVRVPTLMLVSGRYAGMSRSKLGVRRRASTAWIGAAIVCLASTQVPAQQGSLWHHQSNSRLPVGAGRGHSTGTAVLAR